MKCISPVGKQLVGNETTRDLSDNVAPEEGAMDQPHCLWVPVKLSFLEREKINRSTLNSGNNPPSTTKMHSFGIYLDTTLKDLIKVANYNLICLCTAIGTLKKSHINKVFKQQ